MKVTMQIQAILLGVLLVTLVSKTKGEDLDCSKFTQSLCASANAKVSTDTLYVNVFFRLPTDDSSCVNIDIRAYPNSPCSHPGYDSVFWNKLKSKTESLYNKYTSMMMDASSPTNKLKYPGDSAGGFVGAIVTKADLILISKDTTIIAIEPWFKKQLANLRANIKREYASSNYLNWLVNGQIKAGMARVRSFGARVQRQQ
jgi:hypothetical protein